MITREEREYLISIKRDKYALGAEANKGQSSYYRTYAVSMIKDEQYLKDLLGRANYYDVMFYARLYLAFIKCRHIPPYPEDLKERNGVLRVTKDQNDMFLDLLTGYNENHQKHRGSPHHRIIPKNAYEKLRERFHESCQDGMLSRFQRKKRKMLILEELLLLNYVVNSQMQICEMDMKGQDERYSELQEASRLIEPHLKVGYGEEKL